MFRVVLLCCFLVGCLSTTEPPPPSGGVVPSEGSFGILFIGNSLTYTNNLPGMVDALLELDRTEPVSVASFAFPNYGLQDHWVHPETMAALGGGWDLVVMQQGPSATTGRPSLLDYSQRFAGLIRNAGGEPALYMVWPSRARDFDFDGVSDSYATAADLVGGHLFPAGEAWRAAWRRDPDLALYGPDGFHPSIMGTYLAAVVIYAQLTAQDAADLPLTLPRNVGLLVDSATAQILHDAASEANRTFARKAVGATQGPGWR